MAKPTKRQQVIDQLLKEGYVKEEGRSEKYETYAHPERPGYKFFVGKAGAVRRGKTVSTSYSVTDSVRKALGI